MRAKISQNRPTRAAGLARLDRDDGSRPAMEVFVYSRAAIERVPAHEVPHLVVSITSSADDVARIPTSEHTREVVRLVFLDVGAGSPGAMTDADAVRILDAVERVASRIDRLVVHCDAGVSRSPAVALALARHLGLDTTELERRFPRANAHVLETMTRASSARSP